MLSERMRIMVEGRGATPGIQRSRAPLASRSRRAPDREAINPQSRLADADRDALTFLSASADARIEAHVVADHGHMGQRIRPVANEGRTLDWVGDLAVLDHIGFGCGEHKLAAYDIDLAPAEVRRVQAIFYLADDLGRILGAVEHVGVGHARHRHMRIRLAPAVAGGRHAHEPRIQCVLDVTPQNAILDEHAALRWIAFVIDVERSATLGKRAVIDDRHARGGNPLADAAGKSGTALAVEITFESMADGFVQQNAWPPWPQNHGHRAGGRGS